MLRKEVPQKSILCKSWGIKSQIIAFSLTISLLSIVLICGIGLIFFQLIQNVLSSASQEMFDKQTNSQLQQFNRLQNKLTQLKLENNERQLSSIDSLFGKVQKNEIMSNYPPFDCLTNDASNDSYAYKSSFCYMYGNTNATRIQYDRKNELNLTALLTQSIGIWDFEFYNYFSSVEDDEFFALNLGENMVGFRPHSRPWYKNHLLKMGNNTLGTSLFSDPYLSTVKVIFVAQTSNLTYLNNTFAGVVARDITLSQIPKIANDDIDIIITNSSGFIILSKYYQSTTGIMEPLAIYNESITGFSITDWFIIQNMALNPKKSQMLQFTVEFQYLCDSIIS